MEETTIYEHHPVMFRNNPVGFILAVLLIAAFGLGLLILLCWKLKCKGTKLTVTTERTILRKGILSKFINEVYHSDVRNVQLRQTLGQRIFNVGYIGIASAGHSGMEIEVNGIPDPEQVKDTIDKHRRVQKSAEEDD